MSWMWWWEKQQALLYNYTLTLLSLVWNSLEVLKRRIKKKWWIISNPPHNQVMNVLFLVCKDPLWLAEYLRRNCSVQRLNTSPGGRNSTWLDFPRHILPSFFQLEILSSWNLAIFYIFCCQAGWMCWLACIWRHSAGNHAYEQTTCACAAWSYTSVGSI